MDVNQPNSPAGSENAESIGSENASSPLESLTGATGERTAKMLALREQILMKAEHLAYYNDLLIEQCNRWLPAEEGMKNFERKMRKHNPVN